MYEPHTPIVYESHINIHNQYTSFNHNQPDYTQSKYNQIDIVIYSSIYANSLINAKKFFKILYNEKAHAIAWNSEGHKSYLINTVIKYNNALYLCNLTLQQYSINGFINMSCITCCVTSMIQTTYI